MRTRMEFVAGGKATDKDLLRRMAEKQAKLDKRYLHVLGSWDVDRNGDMTAVLAPDDEHFVVNIPSISLQISMYAVNGGVMASTFPSPKVVEPETLPAFVRLANSLNTMRVRSGFFAVDEEDLDLYYRAFIPSTLLRADLEKAREILLEVGVEYFEMLSLPITGIREGHPVENAIGYMNELLDEGFVCDDDYF